MHQTIDHSLNTIYCTLDGMDAIFQMMMEVDVVDAEAIGYLMLSCITSIRHECNNIEEQTKNTNKHVNPTR